MEKIGSEARAPATGGQGPSEPAPLTPSPLDADGLARLVMNHGDRLHRFIVRHIGPVTEAEDLAQQAIAEASRLAHTFRGDSMPSTWLYGIALNLIRNYLSRAPERRYEFVGEDHLQFQGCVASAPDRLLERRQTVHAIIQASDALSPPMRAVFLIVDVHDGTYEQAADRLGIPIGTVRSRLARARASIRRSLRGVGMGPH